MRLLFRIAMLLQLLAGLLASPVAMAATVETVAVEQLLTLSSIRKQLADFPEQLISGLNQARRQRPILRDDSFQRVQKAMRQAFNLEDVLSPVRASLAATLTARDAEQLLIWMRSPSGRRITLAEEAMSAPSAIPVMVAELDAVRRDQPRLALARRFDELLGISSMSLLLQEYTGLAVYTAIQHADGPRKSLDAETYRRLIKSQLADARQHTQELVVLTLAYTYRDIPLTELATYEGFLKEDATRRFYKAAMEGMTRGYAAVLDRMMQAMVDSLVQPPTKA